MILEYAKKNNLDSKTHTSLIYPIINGNSLNKIEILKIALDLELDLSKYSEEDFVIRCNKKNISYAAYGDESGYKTDEKYQEDYEITKILINAGININVKSKRAERSALNISTMYNDLRCVKLFLDHGADIHSISNGMRYDNGYTPLHWAVENHNLEMIQLLLDYGADPNKKNRFWQSSKFLAKELGYKDALQLLKKKKKRQKQKKK